MSLNLLITPNVIINCLLFFEQEHHKPTYDNYLEKIINLSKDNDYSLFMTQIDFEIVNSYIKLFNSELESIVHCDTDISNINHVNQSKNLKLLDMVNSVDKYLKFVNKYKIDKDILNLATHLSSNNPSDALRLATSIAAEQLKKNTKIDAIITWEPSHFCQDTDDFFSVRNSGYGEIKVIINNDYNINDKVEIKKCIYTPSTFIFSKLINNNSNPKPNVIFSLININFNTIINLEEELIINIVEVTIKYQNKLYKHQQSSKSGAISALFLAIYICIKRKCLKDDIANKKLLSKKLIRDIIFSVTPVKGNNRKIHADVLISDRDTRASQEGLNLLSSAGQAYVQIINHIISRKIYT